MIIEKQRLNVIEKILPNVIRISVDDKTIAKAGTGFIANGFFVTNFHVYKDIIETKKAVTLSYHLRSSNEKFSPVSITIQPNEFKNLIKTSSDEQNFDYAILEIPNEIKNNIHNQLKLSKASNYVVGQSIAFLGYPLNTPHVTYHMGVISSLHNDKVDKVNYIQVDASINNGNSGSPLFISNTGEIIGIVTRKNHGLSHNFSLIKDYVQQKIKLDKERHARLCDFIDYFAKHQQEMETNDLALHKIIKLMQLFFRSSAEYTKIDNWVFNNIFNALLEEIRRSANVGIGYAFSVIPLIREIERITSV